MKFSRVYELLILTLEVARGVPEETRIWWKRSTPLRHKLHYTNLPLVLFPPLSFFSAQNERSNDEPCGIAGGDAVSVFLVMPFAQTTSQTTSCFIVARKIPFEDPQVLTWVRIAYVVVQAVVLGTYYYVSMKVRRSLTSMSHT